MRWFYLTEFGSVGRTGTSRNKSITNVICKPKIYEGVAYGTYSNPYYRVQLTATPSNVYRKAYIYLNYNSSNKYTVASYDEASSGIFSSTNTWGMRLFGSIDDMDLSCNFTDSVKLVITEYNNVKLSGRYRSKQTINPSKMNFYVPIDFYVNGVKYNFIGNSSTSITANGTSNDTVIGVEENGNITTTLLTLSNSSETLSTNFQNAIFDFGTGTNAPSFLKEWLDENFEYIYPNSFEIKSQNGVDTYATLNEAPTMVKGVISVIGNSKTLILSGANGTDYTIEWDSITPEGKQFTGISFSPNSKIANIPIGVETYFNLDGDVSLYESYGIYRPPVTTFNVNLYQNTAEANRVDKTNYITEVTTISGVLRDESSITDVTITFESENIPTFNYVYIQVFNRYYFVNDITSLKYKLWQISLSVDPLMTYKDAILSCNGFIDRNENDYNPNVIDKKRVVAQGHTVEVASVSNELFTATNGTYVLNGLLVSAYTE